MKEEKGSEGNGVKEKMKEEELRKWRKFCKGEGKEKETEGNGVKGEWKRK